MILMLFKNYIINFALNIKLDYSKRNTGIRNVLSPAFVNSAKSKFIKDWKQFHWQTFQNVNSTRYLKYSFTISIVESVKVSLISGVHIKVFNLILFIGLLHKKMFDSFSGKFSQADFI